MPAADVLAELHRGFRDSFLTYQQLTAQVHAWAEALPDLVRVSSIGQSLEGRELWLLTIGPEPDRTRPSVWVDGNMHACELAGSSVALAIAEDVIRLHLDAAAAQTEHLPAHVVTNLREVLFYVLPRMSPDGAECVLTTGRYVRSAPRDRRLNQQHPRWRTGDVDGDGLSLLLRVPDPAGEFVESRDVSGVMLPRRLDDPPPYYRIYPEGHIENFDGFHIPQPGYLSDNQTDLNRNFPYSWKQEPEQAGAGAFPGSEPESRAVIEFASAHPEIFAWLNCHTFGGVFIRPLGDKPDNKMNPDDLAIFREIGKWSEEITGYPMVSGFEQFLYEPDKPIHGDLTDFAFYQRGTIAYVVELWDLFARLGMEKPDRFVDYYANMSDADVLTMARWDREHNHQRVFRPWRACQHPQLGQVEVGGIDPRFGLWNPPAEELPGVCLAQSAAFLRVASLGPRISVDTIDVHRTGDLTRLTVAVENHGYLPTYILASFKDLEHNEPLSIVARTEGDLELAAPTDARRVIGHLGGWGHGLHTGEAMPAYSRSRGNNSRAVASYVVRGRGTIHLRIGSCRVGWVELTETI